MGNAPLRLIKRFGARAALGTGALFLSFALLLASIVTLNVNLFQLDERRASLERTNSILRVVAELEESLRAVETGRRGFILTGEPRYLATYERAEADIWPEFDTLAGLVQHPEQVPRIARLRPLIERKLRELDRTIALRSESFDAALAVVRTDAGQNLAEQIDTLLDEFRQAESLLLEERAARESSTLFWTVAAAETAGVLAILSATVGMAMIGKSRAQSRALEVEQRFRLELEHRVEDRTRELSEANRELDAFAYTISHDLRAPLRSMHGFADALIEDFGEALPPEARHYTDRIAAAASRMESLIGDILAYSRLSRADLRARAVPLAAAVERAVEHAAPEIERRQANVEVVAPLPEVRADPVALAQVVENLLENALKFVASGRSPQVRISSERRGAMVRLMVEDRGIGVAPDHQERIFDPFQRLHGVEAYPGTGIGLAIVRRSVERMGGRCGVASELGNGSCFWIELPAAEEAT